jgi:non-heme chloroperoxidase
LVGGVRDVAELLPQFQKDTEGMQKQFAGLPAPAPGIVFTPTREEQITIATSRGERKYTRINAPLLAIFAWPSVPPPVYLPQAEAFETIPGAKVVRLVDADHYIYRSNEADVIREMNAFMDGLQK